MKVSNEFKEFCLKCEHHDLRQDDVVIAKIKHVYHICGAVKDAENRYPKWLVWSEPDFESFKDKNIFML